MNLAQPSPVSNRGATMTSVHHPPDSVPLRTLQIRFKTARPTPFSDRHRRTIMTTSAFRSLSALSDLSGSCRSSRPRRSIWFVRSHEHSTLSARLSFSTARAHRRHRCANKIMLRDDFSMLRKCSTTDCRSMSTSGSRKAPDREPRQFSASTCVHAGTPRAGIRPFDQDKGLLFRRRDTFYPVGVMGGVSLGQASATTSSRLTAEGLDARACCRHGCCPIRRRTCSASRIPRRMGGCRGPTNC